MNILLIGSGGRENTFAWKIAQSPLCKKLYIAPGNAGTSAFGENIAINVTDFAGMQDFCVSHRIDLLVVGPEEPLVKGLRDRFQEDDRTRHIGIVGPGSDGAELEGSKDFSKKFMKKYGVPTAGYETFTKETASEGISYIHKQPLPIVLKADGLAAGKGVLICPSHEEAEREFKAMLLDEKFGAASRKVVIEEFLTGIELSVFVALDGSDFVILPEAKDYKRIGDGDSGPNTGGMGAVSPVPFADEAFMAKVSQRIVEPTLSGLKQEGIDYKGFIFIGLMNQDGEPFVIEYNVRMGDPETQAVLPRIKSDFVALLHGIANQELKNYSLELEDFITTTVVMVAGGYPGSYEKDKEITGLEPDGKNNALVFHAGTAVIESGAVVTQGGRVLGITGKGATLEEALDSAYTRVRQISWEGVNFRKDIGQDILHWNGND
ncbi:Phosphoribosylamine--glycine ligase [Lunatimonas lonarensis]|uniref:Phosphoribosylamine--glycine ligase n=1 Tax=Lunatimonas lonarensis TaxID=1232681 RepID=R7ZS52_9BACT|nr:phosphoribosylamine--glycine ligase [Lunatimonas lonarensis]EON76940.1 Phosphoribosylamine--glycine ligase [Lunatimonas lonarensis]